MTTLAQFRALSGDDVKRGVYGEIARGSFLLNALEFDACAAANGGTALAAVWNQLTDEGDAAGFRAIGSDYTPTNAEVTPVTTVLKILGRSFDIDRVIANAGAGSQIELQMKQSIKAAINAFHDKAINGTVSSTGFAGLAAQTTQEVEDAIDLTAAVDAASAIAVVNQVDDAISMLDSTENAVIITSRAGKSKLAGVARLAGYLSQTEDAFGRPVQTFAGLPILDAGSKVGGGDVIATVDGDTAFYIVRLGLDGFHAFAPAGGEPVNAYLPVFTDGHAVARGAVELVTAPALKSPQAAVKGTFTVA